MAYAYIVTTVCFTVFGQLLIKWRIAHYGALPESLSAKMLFFSKVLVDPFIVFGLASAFVASIFWIAAMTKFDLSYAYPVITAGLTLLTVLLAIVLLGEPLSWSKIVGVILISIGVIVTGQSV